MKRLKIAITGSHGFIGSHLKKRLSKQGHNITEWDLRIDKPIERFNLENYDAVFHLAAWADVRASIEDPPRYWENNVVNTTRIQRICKIINIPLFYASSSCIHNWWLSPYGTSKKVNEETAHEGQVGLRFTTVYGDGARESMLIGKLIRGEVKYLTNHIRDFIHVDDVVDAMLLIMDKKLNAHEYPDVTLKSYYDIGTGRGVIVKDLAKVAGIDVPTTHGDDCEAKDNTADITDLLELGWKPKMKVEEYISLHLQKDAV